MQEYLIALWIHWVTLMSGIGAVSLSIVLKLGRLFSDRIKKWSDVPDLLFICIAFGFLFWAGYLTWEDKKGELDKNIQELSILREKLRSPDLNAKIGSVSWGAFNGQPSLLVVGMLFNSKGPASGVFDWKMFIEFTDGKKIEGQIPILPAEDLRAAISADETEKLIIKAEAYWPKICQKPIEPGGAIEGWLLSTFPGTNLNRAYEKGASVTIEVKDVVTNKIHKFSQKLPPKGFHFPAGTFKH